MGTRLIRWAVIGAALLALAVPSAAKSLGDGKGIDHVALLVRPENFDDAASVLTGKLGFSATPALLSPLGAKNRILWFGNLGYLELATFTERNDFTAPFLDFLTVHEGAKFYGSDVVDANRAIDFLTAAGYPNVGPVPAPPLTIEATGDIVGLSPLWQSIVLTSVLAPDNSTFFLDYDEVEVRRMFNQYPVLAPRPHANTAQKIDTLWLVVADLDQAITFYEGLGLKVDARHQRVRYLGGRGAQVRYHDSTLLLLEPDGPGPVADFAAARGEGILGVSVKVANLRAARHLVGRNTGLHLSTLRYQGRDRFLIPASVTHGLLLEMVE